MGGGGGKTKVEYSDSPEQRQLYKIGLPAVETVAQAVTSGQPLWQVPGMPQAPPVSSVPGPVLPTQQYFQSFAPELKQALWQPYQEVAQQGLEMLNFQGQLGSPRAGATGAAGAFMGDFMAKAAPQLAMQAWQMGAPEMQRYGQQTFEVGQMLPYQAAWQQQQQLLSARQAPYQIFPAMMGGMSPTLPTGIASPQTSMFSPMGAVTGGLGGAGIASLAGVTGGAALPLLIGGGALLGGMGGGK